MNIKFLFIAGFIVMASVANAKEVTFKIETKIAADEVYGFFAETTPDCKDGTCERIIEGIECTWSHTPIGGLLNKCSHEVDGVPKQLKGEAAFRFFAHLALAGVPIDTSIPERVSIAIDKLSCKSGPRSSCEIKIITN